MPTLWGDGHTHSNWSDGFDTLQRNSELFHAYDQDFHVATDHVLVDLSRPGYTWEVPEERKRIYRLGWEEIPAYRAEVEASNLPGHLVVDGLELTWMNAAEGDFGGATDRAHVLVRDNIDRLPEAEFFRGRSYRDVLRELKDREMKPFLAHIYDGIPYDTLDGSEMDGIEMHWDLERAHHFDHRNGFTHWDRWLSNGKKISLTGGSDCHQMDLWAGSGSRNVIQSPAFEIEAIRDALLTGKSFVATTWHPDLYEEHGYPGNKPDAATRFTSWYWMLGSEKAKHDRDAARPLVEKMIERTLDGDAGRTHRTNYPTLTVSVDDETFGGTSDARDEALVQLGIAMTVPVRAVRIISQGELIWQLDLAGAETSIEIEERLPLAGRRYLRVEVDGSFGDGRDEHLIGNPIYLAS
jgi:predicted metal-dependent phosphoesterase TrpH